MNECERESKHVCGPACIKSPESSAKWESQRKREMKGRRLRRTRHNFKGLFDGFRCWHREILINPHYTPLVYYRAVSSRASLDYFSLLFYFFFLFAPSPHPPAHPHSLIPPTFFYFKTSS